ncbi:hypothetical protein RND81_04G003300 [Saponaria officinalis]|uniref:Myb/SANT-like DNA-binding domain-containing protein n=1 Tax=Saponaria officinalis TaxID=3572 RepID=A0AAW1LC76_SAPOF
MSSTTDHDHQLEAALHPTPERHLQLATIAEPTPNPNPDAPLYEPPMGVPLLLAAPPSAASARRLPPPCWTPDETSCLIDAYRLQWLSLRRSNLRANHWQLVADEIHSRCPDVYPPKTAVQCRHKMEKLRKRYRSELLRAKSIPHHRFSSSWVYFSKMDSLDKSPTLDHHHHHESIDVDERTPPPDPNRFRISPVTTSGYATYGGTPVDRINTNSASAAPSSSSLGLEPSYVNPNSGVSNNKKRKTSNGVRGNDTALEMADAIRMLGEGFVRMEKMKMDMMRETARLRMDMEMKRTQMLLDSQRRMVQAFAQGWSDVVDNPSNDS